VKKKVQVTARQALHGPRKCEELPTEKCEEREGQEIRPGRSSGRRGPIWTLPRGAVLVGANVLLREGLARILAASGFRIIASVHCADDRVWRTVRQETSILFIIDLSDDFDAGLRQIACFKQRYPVGRVVVLADQHQLTKVASAFRAGANAYLVKVATCEAFVKSLELVMLGVTLLPPEILNLISDRQALSRNDCAAETASGGHAGDGNDLGKDRNKRAPGPDGGHVPRLSARQIAILRCLAEGDSNRIIARKMAMAEAAVKVHVKSILRKILVRNRTQAAIWAMSNDPLIPAQRDPPHPPEELEPLPNLATARALPEQHTNGSTSLATIKLDEPTDITTPGHLLLVRKRD
jgi:two-component system, NarL family, nitrate/nitrite response regulator NarL